MQKYDIEEWRISEILEKYSNQNFLLPRFQRGLSWDKAHRVSLIDTIRMGKPIGTIMVYKSGHDMYQIIDGLQRVSTLVDYQNNFMNYFDESFIPNEEVSKLLKRYYDDLRLSMDFESEAHKNFENKIKTVIISSYNDKTRGNEIVSFIRLVKTNIDDDMTRVFKSDANEDYIDDVLNDIFKEIETNEKLGELVIPVIIYKGEKDELADVFERLNTGAVVLSKYEIYAAQWDNIDLGIISSELKNVMEKKYNNLTENLGYETELTYDIDENDESLNLFEFCFALSEFMKNPQNINKDICTQFKNSPEGGFNFLSILLSNRINRSEYIEYLFGSNQLNYLNENVDLASEIFDAVKFCMKIMKFIDQFVSFKTTTLIYSEYQKYHLLYSIFQNYYTFEHTAVYSNSDSRKRESFSEILSQTCLVEKDSIIKIISLKTSLIKNSKPKFTGNQFRNNVLRNILMDVFTDFWSLNRQVSDLEHQLTKYPMKYYSGIRETDFKIALNDWIQLQNVSEKYKGNRISKDVKLVNTILHNQLKWSSKQYQLMTNHASNMHFDHLIPKVQLKSLINNLPISGCLNLWPIYYLDNQMKKDRTMRKYATLSEWKDDQFFNEIGIDSNIFELSRKIGEELNTRSNYVEFLRCREITYIELLTKSSKYISEFRF